MSDWLRVLAGGALLYFGAEWLVRGASSLALALRIPQLIVGLTIVAYGTSAPEAIVESTAAANGLGAVAFGDALGSNTANIGLILGVAALIRPARVSGTLARRELPMLLAGAAVVPLLMLDGVVSRFEAVVLLLVAVTYTALMVRAARAASALADATVETMVTGAAADAAGAPAPRGALGSLATAGVGLAVLLVGGNLLVGGAVSVARVLGMSERLVGVTIVAIGTSLPELVTSAVAARRGHSDIAVGNVVGSNIFNIFLCVGVAALFGPVGAPLRAAWFEVGALVLMTSVAAWLIRSERTLSRREGAAMLALYVVFVVVTVFRG